MIDRTGPRPASTAKTGRASAAHTLTSLRRPGATMIAPDERLRKANVEVAHAGAAPAGSRRGAAARRSGPAAFPAVVESHTPQLSRINQLDLDLRDGYLIQRRWVTGRWRHERGSRHEI